MDELLVAWYLFVNNNMDILIMTITLIVVAGLVLEVVRLNRELGYLNYKVDSDWKIFGNLWEDVTKLEYANKDQVNVNVNLAQDIIELQKKLKRKSKN